MARRRKKHLRKRGKLNTDFAFGNNDNLVYDLGEKERREHRRVEYQSKFFEEQNFDGCEICKRKKETEENPFIICEGCGGYFHHFCISVQEIDNPDILWYCNECIKKENYLVTPNNSKQCKAADILWENLFYFRSPSFILPFIKEFQEKEKNTFFASLNLNENQSEKEKLDFFKVVSETVKTVRSLGIKHLVYEKLGNKCFQPIKLELTTLLKTKTDEQETDFQYFAEPSAIVVSELNKEIDCVKKLLSRLKNRYFLHLLDQINYFEKKNKVNRVIKTFMKCKVCRGSTCRHIKDFVNSPFLIPSFSKTFNKELKHITKKFGSSTSPEQIKLSLANNKKYNEKIAIKYALETIIFNVYLLHRNSRFLYKNLEAIKSKALASRNSFEMLKCPVCPNIIDWKTKNFIKCNSPGCEFTYHFECVCIDHYFLDNALVFICPVCILGGVLTISRTAEKISHNLATLSLENLEHAQFVFDKTNFSLKEIKHAVKTNLDKQMENTFLSIKCYVCNFYIKFKEKPEFCSVCKRFRHFLCRNSSECTFITIENPPEIKKEAKKIKKRDFTKKNPKKVTVLKMEERSDNGKSIKESSYLNKQKQINTDGLKKKMFYVCFLCGALRNKRNVPKIKFKNNPNNFCYDCGLKIARDIAKNKSNY